MAQLQEVFLFQPINISGCQLWLDAADINGNGTSVANGSSIATWTDKSGNARNATQSTAGYRPTLGTVNGRTSVAFNGVSNYLALPDITSVPVTIFMIAAARTNVPNTFFISLGGYPNAIFIREFYSPDMFGVDGGLGFGQYQSGIKDLNTHIWSFGLPASANGFLNFDGSLVATSGFTLSANTSFTPNSIGSWNQRFDNGNINAGISEIIMYNSYLSTSQRQQVEGYLAWKWGLQGSLPASHPYKAYRPIAQTPVPTNIPPMPIITQNTPVFNPTSISGCQLWLDAADPTSMNVTGSVVNTWNDKSGSGITYISSNSPTLISNALNGKPVMNFVGSSSQYFYGGAASSCDLIHTHFFVYFNSVQSIGQTLFGSSNQGLMIQEGGGTSYQSVAGFTDGAVIKFQTGGAYRLVSCYVSSSNIYPTTNGTVYFNGTQIALQNNSAGYNVSARPTNLYIGAGNTKYTGTFAEGIVYAGLLTTSQRQQVEGYLAWKWGLTSSLPANHPYRLTPFFPIASPQMTTTGSASTWQPTQISGCQLWLDGADLSSFTLSGSTLTSWSDKSGTSKTITINSAPTYSSNGFNSSYPCFTFTTSNYLTTSLSSTIGTGDCMFVAVIKNTGTAPANNAFCVGQPGGPSEMGVGWNNIESLYKFYQYGSGESKNNSAGNNANIILIGTRLSSIMSCFVNGNNPSYTASNTYSNANTIIYIGGGGTIFTFAGQVCETILYVGTTTTQQRQQVEGYLAWKWGLVGSLPSNHPYKLWPPPS